jgi:hypothetical protein
MTLMADCTSPVPYLPSKSSASSLLEDLARLTVQREVVADAPLFRRIEDGSLAELVDGDGEPD